MGDKRVPQLLHLLQGEARGIAGLLGLDKAQVERGEFFRGCRGVGLFAEGLKGGPRSLKAAARPLSSQAREWVSSIAVAMLATS